MNRQPTQVSWHRRSIRLKGYDYSDSGCYFITICTQGGASTLGAIQGGRMRLSLAGELVDSVWKLIPGKYPCVRGRSYQVMPNHVHGVLEILDSGRVTLSAVVAFFKYQATRRINEAAGTPGAQQFQRGFYDRIIRGDREHFFIERYIELNPLLWDCDRSNPAAGSVSEDDLRARLRREFRLDEYSVERILEHRRR